MMTNKLSYQPLLVVLLTLVSAHRQLAATLACRGADPSWPQQYLTSGSHNGRNGPFCVQLNEHIALQYVVSNDSVLFDVEAVLPAGTAYFAVGLSQTGSMKGADMAVLRNAAAAAAQEGTGAAETAAAEAGRSTRSIHHPSNQASGWWLADSYAPGFVMPVVDAQQDLKLLSLSYSAANSTLRATWLRPLVPCDDLHDLPLAEGMPVYVLWAYGSSWGYHGASRGSKLIAFARQGGRGVSLAAGVSNQVAGDISSNRSSSRSSHTKHRASHTAAGPAAVDTVSESGSRSEGVGVPDMSDISVLDLVFPVDIPPQQTTYTIKYFKLPDNLKYHVVRYEAIINHPMVHHGDLHACLPRQEAEVEALDHMGPYDRAKHGLMCERFYMQHAGGSWDAPAAAALPIGANSIRYVAMELHYNNPHKLAGESDTGSGFRLYYTPKLRQHDMALLTLGQPQLDIPPGVPHYPTSVSVCPSSCTSRFKQPVQLESGYFHMHSLGKEMIVRHFRGGRELTPLGHLRAYEYGYAVRQDIYAPDGQILLPGDSLTVQCTFDSTNRTNVTRWGLGTRDEMCYYWIYYWPAQTDMGACFSFGNTNVALCGASGDFASLKFPGDPATSSTPYRQACSTLPA